MGSPSLLHPLGERRKSMSNKSNSALKINKIQPTDEKITGRGGMSLLVRYADKTGILDKLTEIFRDLRKSKKYNLHSIFLLGLNSVHREERGLVV